MKHVCLGTIVIAALVVFAGVQGCTQTVTTATLLGETTDLRRLAEWPSPAYTTRQFSSYDPKSTTPDDHEAWFANADAGHYIRTEQKVGRREFVMVDAEGPGAIVRIWSANPKGTLRVYLDGQEAPVIEAPMTDLLGGKVAGFPLPIAGERSRGWNLYFPIPYASRCKVTSDDKGFYYHVNYRTYPPGTSVQSFSPEELQKCSEQISAIAASLAAPRKIGAPGLAKSKAFKLTVPAGGDAVLAELEGTQAVTGIEVNIKSKDTAAAARTVVLKGSFDGEQTIDAPIGDFFGTAPGLVPFESLPMGVTEGDNPTMWCHWFMPFARQASLKVKNTGDQPVELTGSVNTAPCSWNDRSLLFHAKWRIERDLPARPMSDWAHLECTGKGRFVGGTLHLINPVRGWWGEGDEKIYVDGEKFPSHFGTGTEDYYGYAWCSPDRFVHAYHNQPRCDGPGNYGNTLVNRFHIIDDIPFTTQFKFDIENWHWAEEAKTTRAAVSYWYARPGGTDFFRPVTAAEAVVVSIPAYVVPRVPGAIEGEKMQVLAKAGNTGTQDLGDRYSGCEQLWWTEGKPGDRLVLGFESPEAGRKHVVVRLTKAIDYGQVQFYVNDQKASEVIDLYAKPVTPTDEIDLGEFDLNAGQNRLTVEIVGANDEAKKAYMFGMDYMLLK